MYNKQDFVKIENIVLKKNEKMFFPVPELNINYLTDRYTALCIKPPSPNSKYSRYYKLLDKNLLEIKFSRRKKAVSVLNLSSDFIHIRVLIIEYVKMLVCYTR